MCFETTVCSIHSNGSQTVAPSTELQEFKSSFTTMSARKDMRTKSSSPPDQLTDIVLAPLHRELAEPKPGAILQCAVHYSNFNDICKGCHPMRNYKNLAQKQRMNEKQLHSPRRPPTACLVHPAWITVMNSCAIY